ncbi:MAG: hypothetical protein OIF50_10630 [Flavobacteriaceae bacterium]|nr:hypothetical protein [Flavobacteriaceae bacterium]
MKKLILSVAFVCLPVWLRAQCAMCRAVIESEEGGKTAEAINDGIVYLMAVPYILVGGLGYFIYYQYKKQK